MKSKIKLLTIVIITLLGGFSLNIWLKIGVEIPKPEKVVEKTVALIENTLELSDKQLPAVVEDEKGNLSYNYDIPTVEEVDGGEILSDDYAQGSYFPTDTWWAFKDATLGRCVIEGNYYGAQCVSLARAFWTNYAGRDFSTCGTGAAKGAWNCKEENAGDEFDLITDSTKLEAGDWIISDGGAYGHVCMGVAPSVNGYVSCLGENQGGHSCGENVGGSATNIINFSLKNFKGAYRPKSYHVITPVTPNSGVYYE